MKRSELEKLAESLHKKANASTGIPAEVDMNEWMAERIDRLLDENDYELADLLEESRTQEDAIRYLKEQHDRINGPVCSRNGKGW